MSEPNLTDIPAPPPARGPTVEFLGLSVRAGERLLLENAAAQFNAGQVTLIVGASGVGKTVLLRVLAGLSGDEADPAIRVSGPVAFNGIPLAADQRCRRVGVVFQHFALFDEFTPLDNVRLARDHQAGGRPAAEPGQLLAELGVPRDVRTAALSGGQRQRLAIARTLAYDPEVLLYDEPTSGLDAATAAQVAGLIQATHSAHPTTAIVVTHDFETLLPIADRVYLFDSQARQLREIGRHDWAQLRNQLQPLAPEQPAAPAPAAAGWNRVLRQAACRLGDFLEGSGRVAEEAVLLPRWLLPWWRSPRWGLRFLLHYLGLIAGPSAWLYIAIAGLIIGFVTTYFTFRYLPFSSYTEPLLIEELLHAMGFALYRILVPVLATILIAARCGAAVSSDVGGKAYGRQLDAMRTLGMPPRQYLLTPILYSFLIGTPLLTVIGYLAAAATSLVAFAYTHPAYGPDFWQLHFHWKLIEPASFCWRGTPWLAGKLLLCALGIGVIAYRRGSREMNSTRDVSHGITSTVLWATLYVLIVHFLFAFWEF